MTRREALRTLAAGAATGALAGGMVIMATPSYSVARMVGAQDNPLHQSQKFTGPAWYAFGHPDGFARRVMWADVHDQDFIALSDGPDCAVVIWVSHRIFDETCCGIVKAVR